MTTFRCQRGSALLLVVGATAALAAMALALLSASLVAYEITVAEQHGALARLLAVSANELLEQALVAGEVPIPTPGVWARWDPPLPSPPPGFASLPDACGFTARIAVVVGPEGPQEWEVYGPGSVLLEAESEAECGRGFARVPARFALLPGSIVVRLF